MEEISESQIDEPIAQEARQETSEEIKVQEPRISRKKRKKGKPIVVILIIIIILAGLGGGAWYLLKEPASESNNDGLSIDSGLTTPESREQPTSVPNPTETPAEIDREEISIQILNGTGIPGEAGLLQDKLEDLGYTKIEVGNSSNQDNETTNVTFASDLSDSVADEITKELEGIYKSVKTSKSSSLDLLDVSVVTGLRKGQSLPTAAPEPTEAPEATATPTDIIPSPTGNPTPSN